MSGMLRANQTGSRAMKLRRVRNFSVSDHSEAESSGSEGGSPRGARLSVASMTDTPARVRFSAITEEIGRLSISASSTNVSSTSEVGTHSSSFQLGQPSGDVFESSPVTASFSEDKVPVDTQECRAARAVTTGSAVVRSTPAHRTVRKSSSRNEMGEVDAQSLYPPSACVFVANLPESRDDAELEFAVTREFDRYGTVFVKIRRETKGGVVGMPYAFAQYRNDEEAKNAMLRAKGTMILGRPCRTEMVKANRTFVIYSRRGDEVTPDIVRDMLEPYGELNSCEQMGEQMQDVMGLPSAVLVEFAKFDPQRDLNAAVRQYDGFRIDAFDVEKKTFTPRPNPKEEWMVSYDQNRRSVFVGDLPGDVTEDEVADIFVGVGEIISIKIHRRTTVKGKDFAFAFVEFARPDTPEHAILHADNKFVRGSCLRVERKKFKDAAPAATPRRVKSQAFSIRGSATPKTPRAAITARSPMIPASGQFSIKREGPTAAAQQCFHFPGADQPFVPGFPAHSPLAPTSQQHQPMTVSGMPCTPTTPFGPTPFTFEGGFWPGMSMIQDPATGHAFYAYTPPAAAGLSESPTRAQATPGGHQFFHGA